MTTFTIESNFSALAVQNYLNKQGVKYGVKNHNKKKPVTLQSLLEAVCQYHKVTEKEMKRKTRKREAVYIRSHFMYLAHDYLRGFSLKSIGYFMDGMDHSTVIHGRNLVREALDGKLSHTQENQKVKQDIQNIISLLS
jgi:chromosomal replication initiation ATPase DnaA